MRLKYLILNAVISAVFTVEASAQQDTVYISFTTTEYSNSHVFRKGKAGKAYPEDGARSYVFKKKNVWGWQDLTFSYHLTKPEGSALVTDHPRIDRNDLAGIDLKDAVWFAKTSYSEIIEFFSGKVIYLIDEGHSDGSKVYLLRVYFSFEAQE